MSTMFSGDANNPGFLNLYGALKDALTVRTGFMKWWSEDEKKIKA